MMRKASLVILGVALVLLVSTACTLYAQTITHHAGSYYFSDCSSMSPHDEDIGWLYEYGITQGFPDGTYGPSLNVTREQMASYVMRQTVADTALSVFVTDEVLFGGYYTYDAYLQGYMTWEDYQAIQAVLDWYLALLSYQISAASQSESRDPLGAISARALAGMADAARNAPPNSAASGNAD